LSARGVSSFGLTPLSTNAEFGSGKGKEKMQKRYPYRDVITTIAVGTLDYLKSKQVKDGELLIITNIAYENQTGARGTFRRYIQGTMGENVMLAELQGAGLGELIFSDKEQVLKAGEIMVVRQASCTAGDILKM
jgi:hypothetical protein